MAKVSVRKFQIWLVAFTSLLMLVLSALTFVPPARNPDPNEVAMNDSTAAEGWQCAQDHYCMGCHTVLGNGAYFAPDLTTIYEENGPAWIEVWLSHPSTFPTQAEVEEQLPVAMTIEQYFAQWPSALDDTSNLGGKETYMPNLQFTHEERHALISWTDYLSQINTNDWPPGEDNNYSFSGSYDQNLKRWPENLDAWAGYWVLTLFLTVAVMFTFFYRLGEKE